MSKARDGFKETIAKALGQVLESGDGLSPDTLVWYDELPILAEAVLGVFERDCWDDDLFDYLCEMGLA